MNEIEIFRLLFQKIKIKGGKFVKNVVEQCSRQGTTWKRQGESNEREKKGFYVNFLADVAKSFFSLILTELLEFSGSSFTFFIVNSCECVCIDEILF